MDGVIAARPRIFKLNHSRGKYRIKLAFWEKVFWSLVMLMRRPAGKMIPRLRQLKDQGHTLLLISGRLSFLEKLTLRWLASYKLEAYFDKVILNVSNLQPHEFKAAKVRELSVKCFYEDEEFAAKYIKEKTRAQVFLVVSNGEEIREI